MNSFVKRTWAEINLNNIEHNYKEIRKNVDDKVKICCVVKADGYGHGAVIMAKTYEKLGADWLAVSNIEEAEELRNAKVELPILILGYTPVGCAKVLSELNITQTVYSLEYAKELSKFACNSGVTVNVHLKLDTGMSRIGVMCQNENNMQECVSEAYEICNMQNLNTQGAYTHFAVSDEDEEGREFTKTQYKNFIMVVNTLENMGVKFEIKHCANSGAIISYPEMHLDMVRAGVILYGLSPSQKLKDKFNLLQAMELKSVISHIKYINEDTSVSYGRTYKADKKIKIATVSIGYADGYIRTIAQDGYVGVNGKKARIVGRICMDQLMIDITDCKDVKVGQSVVMFGNENDNTPTIDDVANFSNTINYEVVCLVGKRVARVYLKDTQIIKIATLMSK